MPMPNVAVNEAPFFDQIKHTTGGLPTLLELLDRALTEELASRLERLKQEGKATLSVEQARRKVTLDMFFKFAAEYLTRNRVVEVFAVDANVGLVLSNFARCVVSPGTLVAGTMQESGAVSVTTGDVVTRQLMEPFPGKQHGG